MFCEICGTVLNPDMECVNCKKKRDETKEQPLIISPSIKS